MQPASQQALSRRGLSGGMLILWLTTVAMLWCAEAMAAVPGCESQSVYQPALAPLREPAQPPGDVSVILVHGKNGSPLAALFNTAAAALAQRGYSVIRPLLPWAIKWIGGEWVYRWDGTQCEGLNYLADLVAAERERGMRVVMMGHSMGGMHSLLYASKAGHGLEAIVAIAPGHMLPLSRSVLDMTAGEVSRARAKVAAGLGDEPGVYATYYGQLWPLQTTPNIFLSYHDVTQTPDFNAVLPAVTLPWYLTIGTSDPNYGFYERAGVITKLPAGSPNTYKVTSGDHYTILDQVPDLFDTWFRSWSQVGAAPRNAEPVVVQQLLNQLLLE